MLLGAVVQVPLHPAPLRIATGHDPSPRGTQLVGLAAELVERGLQGSVQLGVVKSQSDLASKLGQDAVVLLREADRTLGARDHDRPEQLAGVADRSYPDRTAGPVVQQCRHPDRGPGVARHPGVSDHRPLPRGDDDRTLTDVGDRHGELEDFTGAGVDLRRPQRERLAKRLGQLQEQLVHWYGPSQAAPESAHHLVGGFACPVDETVRHAREPVPGRDVADGCDGGCHDRQAEHLAVGRPRRGLAQSADHYQIDGRHHDGEAENRQQIDEQTVGVRGEARRWPRRAGPVPRARWRRQRAPRSGRATPQAG